MGNLLFVSPNGIRPLQGDRQPVRMKANQKLALNDDFTAIRELPVKLLSDWIARKSITFQFRNILFKLRFQGSRGMYFVVSTFQGPKIEMKLMDYLAGWLNSYL